MANDERNLETIPTGALGSDPVSKLHGTWRKGQSVSCKMERHASQCTQG